jgi:hypothetical protein
MYFESKILYAKLKRLSRENFLWLDRVPAIGLAKEWSSVPAPAWPVQDPGGSAT